MSECSEENVLENMTLNRRTLEQRERARGRQAVTLFSKNNTK